MEDPILELKSKEQIGTLDFVKARASLRTKRRIAEQIEKKELKELELNEAKRMNAEARQAIEMPQVKKGK